MRHDENTPKNHHKLRRLSKLFNEYYFKNKTSQKVAELTPPDPKDQRPQSLQRGALLRQPTNRPVPPEPPPSWPNGSRSHECRRAPHHMDDARPGEVHRTAAREETRAGASLPVRASPAVCVPRPVHHLRTSHKARRDSQRFGPHVSFDQSTKSTTV